MGGAVTPTLGDTLWSGLQVLMAVAGALWLMFNGSEHVLKDDVRRKIGVWLAKDPHVATSWPETFITLFDRIFVPKKRITKGGWRPAFWRSCVASILAVSALALVFLPYMFPEKGARADTLNYYLTTMAMVVGLWIVLNIIPDYISIVETRLLLNVLSLSRNYIFLILILIFDFVITALIFFFGLSMFQFLFDLAVGAPLSIKGIFSNAYDITINSVDMIIFISDPTNIFGVFLYSTFLTSAWLWLYVLAALLVRGLNTAGAFKGWLGRWMDLEDKPLRSMGFSLIALSAAVYLVWAVWVMVV